MKIPRYLFFLFFIFILISAYSNNTPVLTRVKGTIIDAGTKDPIAFAGVSWINESTNATLSDDEGNYNIKTKDTVSRIIISCEGYKNKIIKVRIGQVQEIDIALDPDVKTLKDVVVKPKRIKYRNKGNPAVELINNVIAHKSGNRVEDIDFYAYEKYEKIVFSLTDFNDNFTNLPFIRNFKFVLDNIDTTIIPGKKSAPVFLKEELSNVYYQKNPEKKLEVPFAQRMVNFDDYIHKQSVNTSLKMLYKPINIYDNNILLLTNQFLSPISSMAPTFYKYFIMDTSIIENSKCIKLAFFPRNKADFLFQGNLFIVLDSSYAVKKIDMSVNKNINLNWVKNLDIIQEFNKIQNHGWMLTTNELAIDFGLNGQKIGIMGERVVTYNDYQFDKSKSDCIYAAISKKQNNDNIENDDDAFWEAHRIQKLPQPEQNVYALLDSVKKVPAFKHAVDAALLVSSGYIGARRPFEVGPVVTFYSYNPVEGSRIRIGSRTTPHFDRNIYFDFYGAYGTNDERYKYYAGATYLFSNNTIFGFPIKSINISYQNDIKIPGQELLYAQENNILFSFKRGINDIMYYNKTIKIEHLNEFKSHFSYSIGYEYTQQTPAGELYYNTTSYLLHTNNPPYLNISQVIIDLRYAPHEQFFQGKIYRTPIIGKYPVFLFQYTYGNKLLGDDFNYQKFMLDVSKRFYWSFLGYTDVTFETGKIFGEVPFPLLDISRANQTYSYQPLSYNLMNFLEFVNDEYVALFADHCFNGFILNKVPLIKKLKFREYVTCKVLYGGISKDNNPNNPNSEPELYKFPVYSNGEPITYTFGKVPYVEASVGISNVLKFFRIDYVQRLTYLNHPNISTNGIRLSIKLDF